MILVGTEQLTIQQQATGHCTLHSVQSIITRVLGYAFLKSSGIVVLMASLDGQMFSTPNRRYIKLIQLIVILLIVDRETLNRWERRVSANHCLKRHKVRKNSFCGLSNLGLPLFTPNYAGDS